MTEPNIYTGMGDFESFFNGYCVAALWSSCDDDGEPLDDNYDITDITTDSLDQMRGDCIEFWNANGDLMESCSADASQHGHDFLLTRNGHGAGFWDRGYGKLGDQLSEKAKEFGDSNLETDGMTVFVL